MNIQSNSKSSNRETQLRLIAKRIAARTSETGIRLTFKSVADAAGVSTALIHNVYPRTADFIRELQGRSTQAKQDALKAELVQERNRSKALQDEVRSLQAKIRALASINETLVAEMAAFRDEKDFRVVALAGERKSRRQ